MLLLSVLGPPVPGLLASQTDSDEGQELLRSDSGAPYVHRITLYDHDGAAIDPEDEFAGPYSPRMTCAKCHPYAEISRGWHFNAPDRSVPAGRPGEPWLLVEPQTGTQIPISGRAWPGTFKPQDAGLTSWDFVLRFGRHFPGGGYGEPSSEPEAQARANPLSVSERTNPRWNVSGPLEIDCMFCHAADQQHDPAEQASQIEKENFKWAPTAALGLAVVRGEARKAPDDWDPMMPPDPDFPEKAGPRLVWDKSRFDPDNRVLLNITRRPPAERCYFCHSFRQVGSEANQGIAASQDVHLAAGLTCVDCHRNGLDHMIVRGYRTEAQERGRPEIAVFSCEGCHLGVGGGEGAEAVLGGRYGAPHPLHKGLPPVHFEKLTCTACHSGPWPEMNAKRFQTAMAHGLGLASRERKDDDPPRIVGPVFARQHDGKIAPQRMIWPGFWARSSRGPFGIRAIPQDSIRTFLNPAAVDDKAEAGQVSGSPSPDAIAQLLQKLGPNEQERVPFFLHDGRIVTLSDDGHLQTWDSKSFLEYAYALSETIRSGGSHRLESTPPDLPLFELSDSHRWSIAHNVRPAAQSLGVNDCTDCHADDAPIYFGRIADADDTGADQRPVRYMYELRGDDPTFARAWDLGFVFRPAFKWFGFLCAGVVALVLLHYALAGIGAIARRFR